MNTRYSIDPADTDGGVTAALIEEETRHVTPGYVRSLMRENAELRENAAHWLNRAEQLEKRAEKAEQERDEAGAARDRAQAWMYAQLSAKLEKSELDLTVRECPDPEEHVRYDEALAEAESLSRQLHDTQQDADMSRAELESERRPLTAADITDEMVRRFMNAFDESVDGSKPAPSLNHFTSGRTAFTRAALRAALTEPPARPEGAVSLAADLDEAHKGGGDVQDEADRLYAMGYRKAQS